MNTRFLAIICLLIASCVDGDITPPDPDVININPTETTGLQSSEIITDFYFLKLKTPGDIYFGDPDKLLIAEDRIYILDKLNALKLFVFDIRGNFLFDISGYGRGPGELLSPNDFVVDSQNGQIAIFDQGNVKISLFDIESGKFIEDKKLQFWTNSFSKVGNQYVFFNNNLQNNKNAYNLVFTDLSLNIEKREFPISSEFLNFHYGLPRNFTSYMEKLYLTIPFDNTVYSIKPNQVTPSYDVNFGEFNVPDNFFSMFKENRKRIQEVKSYAYSVTNFFESDKFIFFNYSFRNSYNYYFKSKKTGKKYHTSRDKLIFDEALGPMFSWPVEVYNDFLVWYQQPSQLKNYVENIRNSSASKDEFITFKNENKELIELYESVDEEDNAYLIFTKIEF